MNLKFNKLIIAALGLSLLLTGCAVDSPPNSGEGNGNTDKEFVRIPTEPDEFSSDCMAELANDYTLVWTDEFNYTGEPDPNKWTYEVGTGNWGWGNNEKQNYTNRKENSYVENGCLRITAKREDYNGSQYTSARMVTRNKADFTYGYFEMSAKLPSGQGVWPAFWMMPTKSEYGVWPNSGEIDIMEMVGSNPTRILGTTHTAQTQGGGAGGNTYCPTTTSGFNTYGCEWTEKQIKFSINGTVYYTFNKSSTGNYEQWPFDKDFYLILNVAMGGNLGGAISSSFVSSDMLVDYVRVYKKVDRTDKENPGKSEITNFHSTTNSINIDFSKPTDNQGIKRYEIVVDNKTVGATTSNGYTIKNLEQGKNYKVQVIAVDYNDNWSISDPVIIKTAKVQDLPGKVAGVSYSDASNSYVKVVSGALNDMVLVVRGNSTVMYDVNCNKAGDYDVLLNVATMRNSDVKIEVFSGDTVIFTDTKSVTNSYGEYEDIALTGKLNLPSGNYTIKITCTSSTTADAVLLNYIYVK